MRFLLYLPLPLLLILNSFVSSSYADYNYAKRTESDRTQRSNDDVKPSADEDINNLSFDELEKKYNEKKEEHDKLNATLKAAKAAWEQKEAEAKVPREEYETKKKEWEEMDAAANKEKNDRDKAKKERDAANEVYSALDDEFTTVSEDLEKARKAFEKAEKDIPRIENAGTRLPEAKQRFNEMETNNECKTKKDEIKTTKPLYQAVVAAQSELDDSEDLVKGQQTRKDNCKSSCDAIITILNSLVADRNLKEIAFTAANTTYFQAVEESKACDKEYVELDIEIKELTEFQKNPNQKTETTELRDNLKTQIKQLQSSFDELKPKYDAANGTLEEKEKTFKEAEEIYKQNPKTDERIAARNAFFALQPLEEAKNNINAEVEKLKTEYDNLNEKYKENDTNFASLKQVYEEKRVAEQKKNQEEPTTGSAPMIALAVIGLLVIAGIAFLVFMIVTNKKNGRKPLALVLPFGKGGKKDDKGAPSSNPNPSAKVPGDSSAAPKEVSGSKSNQDAPNNESPAVKNNDAPPAAADGQNKQRDGDDEVWTNTGNFTTTTIKDLVAKNELAPYELEHIKNNMKYVAGQLMRYLSTVGVVLVYLSKSGLHERLFIGQEQGVAIVSSCLSVTRAAFFASLDDMALATMKWLLMLAYKTYDKFTPCPEAGRILAYLMEENYRLTLEEAIAQEAFMQDITFIRNFAKWSGKTLDNVDKRSGAGSDVDDDERSGAGTDDDEEEADDHQQTTVTVAKKNGSKKKKNSESSAMRISRQTKVKRQRFPKDTREDQLTKFNGLVEKYGLSDLEYGPHVNETAKEAEKRQKAFEDPNALVELRDSTIDKCIDHLNNCIQTAEKSDPKFFTSKLVHALLYKIAKNVFENDGMLINNLPPDTYHVVADLHGNADDLKRIFGWFGGINSELFKEQKFIFTGDYVDRGKFSLEVIMLLFCLKMKYPKNFVLLRGNHEAYDVNVSYGFYLELRKHFGVEEGTRLLGHFGCCFQTMPLAAIAHNMLFVHGGISAKLSSLKQIEDIDRNSIFDMRQPGLASDLSWADALLTGLKSARGVSQPFGPVTLKDVMKALGIVLIVRGHQKSMDGVEFFLPDIGVITLFSASGYEGHRNFGSVMTITPNKLIAFTMYGAREKDEDETAVKARIHDNYGLYTNYIKSKNNAKKGGPKEDSSETVDGRSEGMKK